MLDQKGADQNGGDHEQPFIAHLVELRQRLVRMVFAVLAVFVIAFPFANDLYTFLAEPLMRHLPADSSMIATDVASPFLTPFKLTLVLSIFVSMPYILYQLWGFIAPGLYLNERRLVLPLVASSTILYYLGMAFAYFVVFPLIFGFFVSVAPEGVSVMTDISKYLDFVLKLFFAFGLAFEVPVATVLLVISGMTTADALVQKRPYIIVGVFVMAMLLTPPDIISQTLLAIPVWFLFEVGIVAARMAVKGREQEDDDGSEPSPPRPSPTSPPASPPTSPVPAAATVAAATATAVTTSDAQRYDPDDDDEGWDDVDDDFDAELDQAIAEEEALDADPRYTDEGVDDELELQSGEPVVIDEAGDEAGDEASDEIGDEAPGESPDAPAESTQRDPHEAGSEDPDPDSGPAPRSDPP